MNLRGARGTLVRRLAQYSSLTDRRVLGEVERHGRALRGKRILQINATDGGGGVAELLRSVVPLERDRGLMVEWQVLEAPANFYAITKRIHNGLQGERLELSGREWKRYDAIQRDAAKKIDTAKWDAVIVHDPQPAGLARHVAKPERTKWIWRCHVDSSEPAPSVAKRLTEYLEPYDAGIFSLDEFRLAGFTPDHLATIPPAIDPLNDKNRPMDLGKARTIMADLIGASDAPLATQVSRFDQWKDPLGVVEAWKLARQKVPDLRLALVGNTAPDDPQGPAILQALRDHDANEPGLSILADAADDRTVRAFQTASDVVLQKSLKEGFGLTVTEALWAGTPVIGGNVGGIRLQIEDGKNGYLVATPAEAATHLADLAAHPDQAKALGECGREIVRENFLLPRLVADELRFVAEVLG